MDLCRTNIPIQDQKRKSQVTDYNSKPTREGEEGFLLETFQALTWDDKEGGTEETLKIAGGKDTEVEMKKKLGSK